MGATVYMVGVLTSAACAVLLLRGYARAKRNLLLWSGLCFLLLALSNVLIFMDLVVLPDVDLYVYRLSTAAIAIVLMLYGLIWESK